MLLAVAGRGLLQKCSVLARPHPCHGEAGRRANRLTASAVVGRIHAHDVAEGAAERAQAPKANVEADVRDAAPSLAEQEHRPLDAPALKVSMRRFAEGRAEGSDVVSMGDAGHPGQRRYVQRLGVGTVDRVAGPQHPAVQLLESPGHETILAHGYLTTARWFG